MTTQSRGSACTGARFEGPAKPDGRNSSWEGRGEPAESHPGRLGFRYCEPSEYLEISSGSGRQPLAAILHGDQTLPQRPWPQVRSRLHPLGQKAAFEVILSASPVSYGREAGFDLAASDDLLFGFQRHENLRGSQVAEAAEATYRGLLHLVERKGYPRLLRLWNILEDINETQEGLERYRHFCLGRHEALAALQPGTLTTPPAACGVGAEGGGLCVYFLAAREPGLPIENPRQVSAYRYPSQHGPRSPSFSRGLFKPLGDGGHFFLSGTASITGHQSRHVGCLGAQVEESLKNVKALIREANKRTGEHFALESRHNTFKAYVRDESHIPEVRDILGRQLDPEASLIYLRSDICRQELLFEIDGELLVPSPRA